MKAKRTYAAVLAAIMAVSSTVVCASAATETGNKVTAVDISTYPAGYDATNNTAFASEVGVKAVKSSDGKTVTVTFNKSYSYVKTIMDDKGFSGNKCALYMNLTTDIANTIEAATDNKAADGKFVFTSGYGWDDKDHHEYNFATSHIMLWLNPSETDKVIKYKVGKGDEQTLTIKYVYATENKVTDAALGYPKDYAADKVAIADKFRTDTGAKVEKVKDGKTVTVSFTKPWTEVKKAMDDLGFTGNTCGLYLTLTTDIDKTIVADTSDNGATASNEFTFDVIEGSYNWDDTTTWANHVWNFKDGKIMLWLNPTQKTDRVVNYKIGGGKTQTITVKYSYPFSDTDSDVKVEAETGVVPNGTVLKVTPDSGVNDEKATSASYDIILHESGDPTKEVKPAEGSKLTVTLPVPKFAKDDAAKKALKVYYYDNKGTAIVKDDEYVDMNAKLDKDGKNLVFDTTHFSTYIITAEDLSTSYEVNKDTKVENGTITVTPATAKEGADVTVDVKADKGYEIDKVTYTVDGKATEITAKDGKYTFKMPKGSVTVSATFKKTATTDPDDKPVNPDDKPTNPDDKPANPDDNKPTNPDDNKPGDNKPGATEDDNKDDNKGDNNGTDQKPTGIALAIAPVVLAGACAVVLAKKKK